MEVKTVREWRKAKGFTSEYVAAELGIATWTQNKKERDNIKGKRSFTTLQLGKLCEIFGVTIDQIDI